MNKGIIAFFAVAIISLVVWTTYDKPDKNDPTALSGKLIITGSSTVAPLASEIAKQFEKLHPHTRIDVQTGGSSRGIADTRQQLADIGMVSRRLKKAEDDLKGYTIAKDGIAIILHRSNPINELTPAQIIDIYLGKINNWQQLGGPDQSITKVHKADGRSTLEVFLDYFDLKNSEIKPSVIIGDNEQGIKLVANNPYAIAYVSIGNAEFDIKLGVPIKALPLNGVAATTKNVANGSFPLNRELNLITLNEAPTPLVKSFLDFALSPAVSPIIQGQSFVALAQ